MTSQSLARDELVPYFITKRLLATVYSWGASSSGVDASPFNGNFYKLRHLCLLLLDQSQRVLFPLQLTTDFIDNK